MTSVLVLLTALSAAAEGDEKPEAAKYRLVTPKDDGIIAIALNGLGDLIGFEWVEEKETPGVLAQAPFFARGKEQVYLPLLKGYTATFPADVSDTGLVVGRVSKPATPGLRVYLRNQAFIWDAERGMRGLGAPADDWASLATGVSRDGTRISGFSVGDDRVRACVWDRDGDAWRPTILPHRGLMGAQVVVISDDGRRVAAVDVGQPCLWTLGDDGAWTQEMLGDPGTLIPRAVNNAGTVVGLTTLGSGHPHAVIWTREGGIQRIPEPEGYVRSEASAINNAGVVVGMVDGPNGSDIGPDAFAYEAGTLRLIKEAGPWFTTATAINDQGQIAGVVAKEEEEPAQAAPESRPKDNP